MQYLATRDISPEELSETGRQFWNFVQDDLMPNGFRRVDFDPVEIPLRCLPWLMLFDRRAEADYHCRLFGTGLTVRYGRDMTGRTLSELLTAEPRAVAIPRYEQTVAACRPSLTLVRTSAFGHDLTYERVIVPLIDDEGTVRWVGVFVHETHRQPVHARHTALEMLARA